MRLNKDSFQKYLQHLSPIPTALSPWGALKKKIECVLFDVYGTLFISGMGNTRGLQVDSSMLEQIEHLLADYAIPMAAPELLQHYHSAIETEHEGLRKKGIDFPEVEIEQIWMKVLGNNDLETVRRFAIEFEWIANPVYPMPNLEDLLSACRRQGLLMGIVSNAQFYTPLVFKWFLHSEPTGLGFHRDLIFYSYRFGVAKPSQMLIQIAVAKLKEKGIQLDAVLFVGNDMLNDIYPAAAAGMQTALYAGDQRSLRLRTDDARCKNLNPNLVITNLLQLAEHLLDRRDSRK
jgi:putative hydrolase of the HAD superfamily